MAIEPTEKRVVAFVDGQNLFHSVKEAFGYSYPNYDIHKLAGAVCARETNWVLKQTRFYSGVPKVTDNPRWHNFWKKKLSSMGRHTYICTRDLRYRILKFRDTSGAEHTGFSGVEKGIDVRIALDVIRGAHARQYDVAIIFSQDQDLAEVVREIINISQEQDLWIKIASAFPVSPVYNNARGINASTWLPFDKSFYDNCIDPKDYA